MLDGKVCSRCRQLLPLESFGPARSSKDGLNSKCKPCNAEHARAWHHANKDRIARQLKAARATDPERFRIYGQRARERHREKMARGKKRWATANRDLINARHREQRAADPERFRAYTRRYRAKDAERTKLHRHIQNAARRSRVRATSTVPFTATELAARLSMFPGCWMCGGPKQEIDHVKPLVKGGMHCLANLRPICSTCNRRKGSAWPLLILTGRLAGRPSAGWSVISATGREMFRGSRSA